MFTCCKFLDLSVSSSDSWEICLASAKERCSSQEMNPVECMCDFCRWTDETDLMSGLSLWGWGARCRLEKGTLVLSDLCFIPFAEKCRVEKEGFELGIAGSKAWLPWWHHIDGSIFLPGRHEYVQRHMQTSFFSAQLLNFSKAYMGTMSGHLLGQLETYEGLKTQGWKSCSKSRGLCIDRPAQAPPCVLLDSSPRTAEGSGADTPRPKPPWWCDSKPCHLGNPV